MRFELWGFNHDFTAAVRENERKRRSCNLLGMMRVSVVAPEHLLYVYYLHCFLSGHILQFTKY